MAAIVPAQSVVHLHSFVLYMFANSASTEEPDNLTHNMNLKNVQC